MTREDLARAIARLEAARSDTDTTAALIEVRRAAPHARVSDLVFHSERERSREEIADEALARETIWSEGGDFALNAHIEAQLLAALSDPSKPDNHYTKVSARMLLSDLRTSTRTALGEKRPIRSVITIDCGKVTSEGAFWRLYLDSVKSDGSAAFGSNLDAFWDALERGGPGGPGEVDIHFINAKSLSSLRGGEFLAELRRIASELTSARVTFD